MIAVAKTPSICRKCSGDGLIEGDPSDFESQFNDIVECHECGGCGEV